MSLESAKLLPAGTSRATVRQSNMTKEPIYDDAGDVSAEDGVVSLDGPDSVHVKLTVEAAEEISDRLLTGALKARGQNYFTSKKARRA